MKVLERDLIQMVRSGEGSVGQVAPKKGDLFDREVGLPTAV